jgi:hypothetical protein
MIHRWFRHLVSRLRKKRPSVLPISRIYISGCRGDFEYTKCCVASIRQWYPSIPITLIKDHLHGDYDTSALERAFRVEIFRSERLCHGFGTAKLEPLFQRRKERCLILDSDTVFLGPVLARFERFSEDFVVTYEDHSIDHIRECYFDPEQVQTTIDPDFVFPGYTFNTGHFVARTGLLRRRDFAGHIEFETTSAEFSGRTFFAVASKAC